VAEDHQTKNALALVNKNAALYVRDVEAKDKLMELAMDTVRNTNALQLLSDNIRKMAFENSADIIADEVYKLAIQYRDKKK
jgi:UDP-N-acetylglucosamine--N-acetylmuramyl-(pentapeptide) pyrophosphoryl-undecaprenol N-acetylglucosamine transferase